MQKVLLIGLSSPYVPYLTIDVEKPMSAGDLIGIGDVVYEVYKADPVLHEGRLQNVYIKEKENGGGEES